MKTVIADTNVFLRFFLNDIPEQKKLTEKLLYSAKNGEIVLIVPEIIIFELSFILDKYYHFNKEVIVDKLTVLSSASYVEVESKDIFVSALSLYKSSGNSFVDCFILAKTQAYNAELFTFDEKLKKVSRQLNK